MSERVFIDTSAYYSFVDANDTNHAQAMATLERFGQTGAELYTTNFVVAETHALILNRLNRDAAERVLVLLYAGGFRVLRATEGDETRARALIHHHRDKEYSLVDAISFVVMQRLHIHLAWSYDQHFASYGFILAS